MAVLDFLGQGIKDCFACIFCDMRLALYLFQNLHVRHGHCLLLLVSK